MHFLYKLVFLILIVSVQSCFNSQHDLLKDGYRTTLRWHDSINHIPERVFISKNKGDQHNGVYLRYHSNGNIYFEVPIKSNKKHGVAKSYRTDGCISYECEYSNGVKQGQFKTYTDNGTPNLVGMYYNGIECGDWTYLDSIGNIVKTDKHEACK